MGWDKKANGQRYYYKAKKVCGRCVKTYVGAGPAAALAAALDAAEREGRRRRREAWRAEVAALAAADQALADLAAVAGLVYRAALVLAGYHVHHGDWRRRSAMPRTAKKAPGREAPRARRGGNKAPKPPRAAAETGELGDGTPPAAPDYRQLFRELVERANRGEELAITRLRRFLDLNPSVWERAGDLAAAAEAAWVGLVAGPDRLVAESVRRRLARLRADLKGARATPPESLLAEQAALAWLAARHAEIEAAGPAGGSPQQAALRLRRAESAQKRLVGALKALATLRALAPTGRVPADGPRLVSPQRERA
jgi:hypothetical protein